MKKLFVILLSLIFFSPSSVFAQPEFPEYVGYVNDFAGIISDPIEAEIVSIIEEIKTITSAEVAVVTVESMDGYDSNYYSVELGRAWGVGNAERDDGVVFLTSVGDRETYIATGYGVEHLITDAQAFWITEYTVVPYFRNGEYGEGILAGMKKIKDGLLELEPLPTSYVEDVNAEGFWDFETIMVILFFLVSFMLPWVIAVLGRSERWWPGGIAGAVIGLVIALVFAFTFLIIIPLALFGFLVDYLASKNYKNGKDSWWTGGGSSGWGGSSGSSWGSGGGSSSGSSSGSSFGGFSGGSFGGGGGGSSW